MVLVVSDAPDVVVPSGFELQHVDGVWTLVRSDERLTKPVSFRVTPSERAALAPFFDSFRGGSTTEAMRWLMSQPTVKALMAERVEATRTGPPTPR